MTANRRALLVYLVVAAPMQALSRADAQGTDRAQATRCDRVGTTSITFGRTAGNIRPSGVTIAPNGIVSEMNDIGGTAAVPTSSVASVPRSEVRRLARRAWTGSFAGLRTAPTRPTPNPDAARDFIELRSKCGVKHVEYQHGTGAPEFRRLLAALEALTSVR